jgi:hypothetical protein
MKATTVLISAVFLLGLTGVAHATNMFAGPLFPNGATDGCVCEIVNVSTSSRTLEIQALNKGGVVTATSGTITLAPGVGDALNNPTAGFQYCKFMNASPSYFRATIVCSFDGSIVAVPAG